MINRKRALITGLGAVLLVAMTAGASAFITRQSLIPDDKPVAEKTLAKNEIRWNNPPAQQPAPQRVANCDDGNIVGKVVGGVGGGVLGSQLGKGDGKTAGTIAGTLGGAYVGGKVIPTDNVTCD